MNVTQGKARQTAAINLSKIKIIIRYNKIKENPLFLCAQSSRRAERGSSIAHSSLSIVVFSDQE